MQSFIYFRYFLLFYAVLLRLASSSSTHLPFIMALYALYRLSQRISPAMLMIRMLESMLMKNHQAFLTWISGTMQVPVMTGIPALDRHITVIRHDDIKINWIYFLYTFCLKHPHLLSQQLLQLRLHASGKLFYKSGANLLMVDNH